MGVGVAKIGTEKCSEVGGGGWGGAVYGGLTREGL